MRSVTRSTLELLCVAVLTLASVGCGRLTIRTWVNVIEEESGGSVKVDFLGQNLEFPLSRLQGGFFSVLQVDTHDIALGPMQGTITLEELRIAGKGAGAFGTLCTWGDPNGSSTGSVVLDLSGGESSAEIALDLRATSNLSQLFHVPPADLEQIVDLPIGTLTLESLLAAQQSGEADGLFSSNAAFEGATTVAGFPAVFALDLAVANESTPPPMDLDLLFYCAPYFLEGKTHLFLYYGMNTKSTYLRVQHEDTAAAPLVIRLDDIGAQPGRTLHIETVGTYSDETLLKDGTDRRMSAVFSATDVLADPGERNRVTGAIDAGVNVKTNSYLECFLLLCTIVPSDIPQDFRVDPSVDVVVPEGAEYLFLSPTPASQKWADNSGFGFGVNIEVN